MKNAIQWQTHAALDNVAGEFNYTNDVCNLYICIYINLIFVWGGRGIWEWRETTRDKKREIRCILSYWLKMVDRGVSLMLLDTFHHWVGLIDRVVTYVILHV